MALSNKNRPIIVITVGDPLGIGPEITKKALRNKSIRNKAFFFVFGNLSHKSLKKKGPTAWGGRESIENIRRAVSLLRSLKTRKALVTAPISKYSLAKSGSRFSAHTELLANLTNTKDVAMMFCAEGFKITLVTRHVPISKISKSLTEKKIIKTTELFYHALKKHFRIKNPKIGIAGLNPHAGESGILGREENNIIIPAVKKLRRRLSLVDMPRPADSLFYDLYRGRLDGIVCMYHDQGLIPFKMLNFHKGVNVTLGLPFIRTSPDHGTAFDIAGKGKANPSSMIEAIRLAIELA